MTASEFRRIALSLENAEERAHMGHPDFRVAGKIFATLGYPDDRFGMLVLSPEDQAILVRQYPKAFTPAAGAWGRAGSTSVQLQLAPKRALRIALEAAWERRARKMPKRARSMSTTTTKRRPQA